MWLALAFLSAFFLGCYDISKKMSVNNNAVIPVLLLNAVFCTLIFLPIFIFSRTGILSSESILFIPNIDIQTHGYVFIKSVIVLSSWMFSYFAVKHLPLTITGPINATRPIMTLVGAFIIFGERLNTYQWIGVLLTIISIFLLSSTGKKEGINFKHNKWIVYIFLATALGAISGLYDKFLMQKISSPTAVQFWFNTYQCLLMFIILMSLWYPRRKTLSPFSWRWSIIGISIFLSLADFVYLYALTDEDAMISVVSMVRRSSVLISFAGGVLFFNEKNLKGKAMDLLLIIVGMFFLYLGTK